jgi:pilus assembly protein CpaC
MNRISFSSAAKAAIKPAAAVVIGVVLTVAHDQTASARSTHARTAARTTSVDGTQVDLAVGEQTLIPGGQSVQRVAIADPSVADVLVTGGANAAVILTAKAPGSTTLLVWRSDGGEPVRYAVSVQSRAAGILLKDTAGRSAPRVAVAGNVALLSGSTPTMTSHERASAAALASLSKGGTVVDASTIATSAVVQVDVRVVEFSKTVLKQAGFNLFRTNNGFAFGAFAPSSLTSQTSSSTSGLTVQSISPISSAFNLVVGSASKGIFGTLSLMEGNNMARVLAEPSLTALSGQSASFLAGGEIPIPVPQGLGTTSIEFKPYGIGLTVTPTVLGPDRIALKVAPEASQLDFTNALTINGVSVPALTTRRADTTVELGDGESFVIGGLVDRETASSISKVPLLGDLPIIGAFFKSLAYQQNDKELVIIVTPHLVTPIMKGAALPGTPGEQSEERNGPVWRQFIGGVFSRAPAPGFSR